MGTAIWTLWLVINAGAITQANTEVTALATYGTMDDCVQAHNVVLKQLRESYLGANPPPIGVLICVPGAPVKH